MIAGRTELIEVKKGKLGKCLSQRNQVEFTMTHFQGAITKTTPSGSRLMYRLKPGLSVSFNSTGARAWSAMDSM
jgi:hypothetical protein